MVKNGNINTNNIDKHAMTPSV